MIVSSFLWRLAPSAAVDPDCARLAAEHGLSDRLVGMLSSRGVATAEDLARFLAPPEEGLYDPWLLPDAEAALRRVARAREQREQVLVYGDFDADGLTGLSILVLALRAIGLDVMPYAPERLGDGHGLSVRAVERAAAEGRTLIVTADCGTSSPDEIGLARSHGIDVIVTDHHHASEWPKAAVAVVNPMRTDSLYPFRELTGAGVAWKFSNLILNELDDAKDDAVGTGRDVAGRDVAGRNGSPNGPGGKAPHLPETVRRLADLALIGTVADVAPIVGENRSIAVLGLEQLRAGARPGLAALMARAGLSGGRLNLDSIAFAIAPRLNAAGRVGEAGRAARLLLAANEAEAGPLADEIEQANLNRREITKSALAEARTILGIGTAPGGENGDGQAQVAPAGESMAAGVAHPAFLSDTEIPSEEAIQSDVPLPSALLVRGDWPVGIIGLIAGRLAEDFGRPAIVATALDSEADTLRASCRSGGGVNLAEALIACSDLLIRHGGHRAAAGFDIEANKWPAFQERFLAIAAETAVPPGPAELNVDLVVAADAVDFDLLREIAMLAPTGAGNPAPCLAVTGLTVVRTRAVNGGHTQLVLRRSRDVIDGIAFRRPDLATMLHEGDRIDVAARAGSRTYGGFESLQLEVVDVAAAGTQLEGRS
jgi:single-stranded-DNA-specific exonuclease